MWITTITAVTGEELADLVDCRTGSVIHQIPSKTFWNGFEDIHGT